MDTLKDRLRDWIVRNKLKVEFITDTIFKIGEDSFQLIEERRQREKARESIFTDDFELNISEEDESYSKEIGVGNFCFEFGSNFYYTPAHTIEKPELNILKYIGVADKELDLDYSFLGVRGQFELCNGSGDYTEWVQKAKFLGIDTLAIAEHNTLAGTLLFQKTCEKKDINFVLGETITIKDKKFTEFFGKCYVLNEEGWFNLLYINKTINVDNAESQFIDEESLLKYGEGLAFVFDSETELSKSRIKEYTDSFDKVYYQLDMTEYRGHEKEQLRLLSIKNYLDNYVDTLEPILIQDAFYLDEEYSYVKTLLNKIGSVRFQFESQDQWFKSLDEIFYQWQSLFTDEDERLFNVFLKAVENTRKLTDPVDFKIETEQRYLPKFEWEGDESNEDLFFRLIKEGMEEKGLIDNKEYWDRIEKEVEVITLGGVVDYFLILWDIIKWCEKKKILTGVGRGSAAGSLVSYVLNITQIDPIEYGLLFERFLNKGRLGGYVDSDVVVITNQNNEETVYGLHEKLAVIRDGSFVKISGNKIEVGDLIKDDTVKTVNIEKRSVYKQGGLPDIDVDFEGLRREEVKRYMEEKYGLDYVCSVGTYGTFKIKSAIRDLGRYMGLDSKETNYITSKIGDDGRYASGEFFDIFRESQNSPQLREFILKRPDIVEFSRVILKQQKNQSVHPCATLILPKVDQKGRPRNIYNWIPVKKIDGVLVSEWEGGYLEDAGFLKEDILGIKQLDKFRQIFNKVEVNRQTELSMGSVDLENEEVYDLFRQGLSADVFHFGSKGLTSYAHEVMPNSIEDMIAMISLYRPGPIESGAHTDYVKLKFGLKEPEYDYMLEEVIKSTYGLYAYQEQVMLAVQGLGGMDLVTADDVRKAMGKMNMSLIKEYREVFIKGAAERGCDEVIAESIWNKLEAFARYGFNRSHAAAYSYTGIMCQWLKVKFPIEFWTTALEFAEDKQIPRYVSEISKLDHGVSIVPPNVNKSSTEFTSNFETGRIYWAINKIKFVGDTATDSIIEEREKNGEFFSLEEFCSRVEKKAVNKRTVENLILSGSFDEIYDIDDNVKDRELLLQEFYKIRGIKPKEQIVLSEDKKYNWYWTVMQKKLSGLGNLNFSNIILNSDLQHMISQYLDPLKLQVESSVGKRAVVCGLITDMIVRKTRKGDEFCSLTLESNDETVYFLLWPDAWEKAKEKIRSSESKMFIGSATVHIDNFKKCNVLQSDKNTKIQVL